MDETTYMPALITGFIGLFGVILGGLLQIGAQIYRDRKHEAYEIRKKASELVSESLQFASGVSQLVREVNESNELHTSPMPHEPSILRDRRDLVNEISKQTQNKSLKVHYIAIEMTHASDRKMTRQAHRIQKQYVAA